MMRWRESAHGDRGEDGGEDDEGGELHCHPREFVWRDDRDRSVWSNTIEY
jgi:hypothetical protein